MFEGVQDNNMMLEEKSNQNRESSLAKVGASGFESIQFFFNVTLEEFHVGSEKDLATDEMIERNFNEEGGLWKKREERSETQGGLWKRDEGRMKRPGGLWRKDVRRKDQKQRVRIQGAADQE